MLKQNANHKKTLPNWQVNAIKPKRQTYDSLIFCAYDKTTLKSDTILFYIVGSMDYQHFFSRQKQKSLGRKIREWSDCKMAGLFCKNQTIAAAKKNTST